MSDLTRLTLAEARDGLKKKSFSATELTEAHIAAIEAANPAINAYVLTTPEHALAQAKASDARLAKGEARPLEGLPGNKDLFCTVGIRTTACSKIPTTSLTYESPSAPISGTPAPSCWASSTTTIRHAVHETSAFGPVICLAPHR